MLVREKGHISCHFIAFDRYLIAVGWWLPLECDRVLSHLAYFQVLHNTWWGNGSVSWQ